VREHLDSILYLLTLREQMRKQMEDQAQANHTRFLTGCGNLEAKSHPVRQRRRGIAIDGVSKILKLTLIKARFWAL
jgi:hypothetical protein